MRGRSKRSDETPRALERRPRSRFGHDICATERDGSIVIEGGVQTWKQKIEAGWAAARLPYRNVVNDLRVPGVDEERLEPAAGRDQALAGRYYDVAIIGGGVIGAAIARELSRWDVSVVLLEKENDIAVHTSSRNDGMIHDGFAAKPCTKKVHYNIRGNRLWEPLCRELGVDFKRPGSLVLFGSALEIVAYPLLAERARRNGVDGWDTGARGVSEPGAVSIDETDIQARRRLVQAPALDRSRCRARNGAVSSGVRAHRRADGDVRRRECPCRHLEPAACRLRQDDAGPRATARRHHGAPARHRAVAADTGRSSGHRRLLRAPRDTGLHLRRWLVCYARCRADQGRREPGHAGAPEQGARL